jgi:DNA-binding NarL/FixJ family response regulator
MKVGTSTRAISAQRSTKGPRIGVAGPYQWSTDLLMVSISSRLRRPIADLCQVDQGLVVRIVQKGIDVLVADISGAQGIPIIECIHRRRPTTSIMALSIPNGHEDVVALVQSGVTAIVPPTCPLDDLITDLRFILRSAGVCTPRVADMLAHHVGRIPSRYFARARPLSPRETEVANLLAEGFPNKLIADALNISQGTVKNHIHRIFEKMSIQRRADIPERLSHARQILLDPNSDRSNGSPR